MLKVEFEDKNKLSMVSPWWFCQSVNKTGRILLEKPASCSGVFSLEVNPCWQGSLVMQGPVKC
jgi:hypothetical protein